jgi:hypothetical protein
MKYTDPNWQPRSIKLVPTKEKLTDATGLGTMIDVFNQSPLSKAFKECLPQRTHVRSHGSYRLGLIQISSLLYGHDSIDDLEEFRTDPALAAIMKGETVAARTMGDFLRDFTDEHLEKLNKFLAKMAWFIRGHLQEVLPEQHKPSKAIHAGIDSTAHEQTGQKMEGLAFNYDGKWCLDSQQIFDEMGLCYGFQLRPGNTYSSEGAEKLIDQLFENKVFQEEKYISGDSAYCDQGIIRKCLSSGIKFTVTAHEQRTGWETRIGDIDDWEAWKWTAKELRAFERAKQQPPQREVGRFHWHPSWQENIQLNIVVKREWVIEKGTGLFDGDTGGGHWKYYAVVSNISLHLHTKQEIIERHNKRGNLENFIRDGKYGMDLKHFPCLKMRANHAYGLLAMVANNILRWVALVEKPDKPHYCKKLRRRYVFIPGKVVQHARQIIMKVPMHFFKEVQRLREAWRLKPCPALGFS